MSERIPDAISSTKLIQHIHLGGGKQPTAKQVLFQSEVKSSTKELDEEFVRIEQRDLIHTVHHLLQAMSLQVIGSSCMGGGEGRRGERGRKEGEGGRKGGEGREGGRKGSGGRRGEGSGGEGREGGW